MANKSKRGKISVKVKKGRQFSKGQRKSEKKLFRKKIMETKEIEPIIIQPPRGMKDILPDEQSYWEQTRRVSERLARDYGFSKIDVPLLEY